MVDWVRPDGTPTAEPRWGHRDGLQIGLAPLPGPRGLIRIYAPYLDQPRERLLNFVAVEPIPRGTDRRGFSELERSALDAVPGKRFWSADRPGADTHAPARGVVDGQQLTVYVMVEPFDNGADVYVRVRFDARRPHEVAFAGFANPASVPLDRLVLTATMGNWARLRQLHLRDRVVEPSGLWPDHSGDGFTAHARFGLDELARDPDGAAVVTATPDEADPTAAAYAPGTAEHWHYVGRRARQGWRVADPAPGLEAWVNGRYTYWASTAPIPGGVAYENVELVQPFAPGQEYVFTVEPLDRGRP